MIIKPLTNTPIEQIHEAFLAAFSDYEEPVMFSVQQLKHMIERRGYEPDISYGAFENENLVGFTLNGLGEWNGRLTAYDTGTGIQKEYRSKGIATQIFEASLPVLKEKQIDQYLLEVIQINTSAVDLYKKLGFKISRTFDYYVASKKDFPEFKSKPGPGLTIKEIQTPDWQFLKTFWDMIPSWQNSIYAVERKKDCFKIFTICDGNTIVGYGIIEPATGDIPHLAISKSCRRNGYGTALLFHLIDQLDQDPFKLINIDSTLDTFKAFTKNLNLPPGHGQFEMMLTL
ncbi:GNAT family N-acetyltransferase [Desulfobacula sp.]|uniref:GNAT family N-acetyltransferase n=1 Tax=Desulfobacula sp. TaxID=2593537 RepID=UPI0026231FB0|nr:GNAT family N-acetyltransferase [Desulfobacula sp.]